MLWGGYRNQKRFKQKKILGMSIACLSVIGDTCIQAYMRTYMLLVESQVLENRVWKDICPFLYTPPYML